MTKKREPFLPKQGSSKDAPLGYVPPRLIRYGKVERLTTAASGVMDDAMAGLTIEVK